GPQALHDLGGLLGRDPDELEAVAAPHGAPVRRVAVAADPDRHRPGRLGEHPDVVEVRELAVEARWVVAPHGAEHVDGLVEAAATVAEVVAQRRVLGFGPTDADPDDEPPAGE